MSVDDRIAAALDSDECAGAATLLAALVYSLRAEGMSKQAIAVAYYDAWKRSRAAGQEERADAIADILDVLRGACSPSARLLPEEPDAQL